MRLTVYRRGDGFTFWEAQGEGPVELELAPGWSKGLSQFGKTMLIGPSPSDALDISTAIDQGIARVVPEA